MENKTKKRILNKYKQGQSILSITNELKSYSYYAIQKVVKESGIPIRGNAIYSTKYTYNTEAFKIMDENSAYWLGFLLADGSMNIKDFQVKLDIAKIDKKHLEKLQKYIGTNKPISCYTNNNGRDYVRLVIANKPICQRLLDYGLVPKKTSIVTYPNIPKEMDRHFIRGYIDGDGSIKKGTVKNGIIIYNLDFIGTDDMIENIIKRIPVNKNYIINKKKRHESDPNSNISIGGKNQIRNVIDFLYKDCNISLDRKQDRANYILDKY